MSIRENIAAAIHFMHEHSDWDTACIHQTGRTNLEVHGREADHIISIIDPDLRSLFGLTITRAHNADLNDFYPWVENSHARKRIIDLAMEEIKK